jgi:histone acetyltransferase (RNA polymerase elongator complex component)
MDYCGYEQGPIRPPSEAGSLLVRVSRNCPWNRCAFCPVYKGAKFSLRTVEEVLTDLEAMKEDHGDAPRTVFLQDANPLLTKPDDLIEIIRAIRSTFPNVERITAYARSHTLARRSSEDLLRLRKEGLDRLHVGMESGCDEVLDLVSKGSSREEMIEGGRRAKQAGFELSEYIMPGLGGTGLTYEHAADSASALVAIKPDFIRLRTTVVIPGTPLARLQEEGKFEPLSEITLVKEIRRFLAGLEGLETRIESDHMLNLLMEIRGDLPRELDRLVAICDSFLELTEKDQQRFVLARRLNLVTHLNQRRLRELQPDLDRMFEKVEQQGGTAEQLFHELRQRMV